MNKDQIKKNDFQHGVIEYYGEMVLKRLQILKM